MGLDVQRADRLYEQGYEILWEKILAGELKPGDRFRDTQWAQKLGVSRTPVQQAMRMLERDGILITLPQGGCQLRQLDPEHLRQIYACRAVLEGLAAREAASQLTVAQMEELDLTVRKGEEELAAGNLQALMVCNSRFHSKIIEAGCNPVLSGLLASLQRLVTYYRTFLLKGSGGPHGSQEAYIRHLEATAVAHAAILSALQTGDAARVEQLARDHVLDTARDMGEIMNLMTNGTHNLR